MDVILQVCQKKIKPHPKKVIYSHAIEESILSLGNKLREDFILPDYLLRWISLKIIDGETKILESIEKNFSINILDNAEIQLLRIKLLNKLKEENVIIKDFKDIIVSTIIEQSEKICNKVCTFNNLNYSRKRSKNR